MVLENIVGNLREAYALVEPETMLHSDELQLERLTNSELRNFPFYTAEGNLYDMHEGKSRLSITRRDHNLILSHIDDAYTQLLSTGNYHSDREESNASFAARSTVCIDLKQLRLFGDNNEWGYIPFSPQKYNLL
ncbi:MAG: hypothetical protein Q8R18_02410, partial [bacterium]|nr:hypothetical protein [bacterium]